MIEKEILERVNKLQSQVDALARREHRQVYINVKDYGVTGDGVTDDSAALTLAVAAAGGKTLYFPPGTYILNDVAIGTTAVNLLGDPLGTTLKKTSNTNFMLTYIGNLQNRRRISNIRFLGVSEAGRGVYVNGYGYLTFESCTFDALEYGIYMNGAEWTNLIDCGFWNNKYAYITTYLDSDVLGNAAVYESHSGTQYFAQCEFMSNSAIAFHCDNKDLGAINPQGSNSFEQCRFLANGVAITSVQDSTYQANVHLHPDTTINSCWFELNTATGTQSFNGFTINNGDLHFSYAAVNIQNTLLPGRSSYLNGTRVTGSNVHFGGSYSTVTSGDVSINIDSVAADDNGGTNLSVMRLKTFEPVLEARAVMAQVPHRAAFTFGPQGKNILSDAKTATCAMGAVPPTGAGTPTVTIEHGDGFYGNGCVQVDGAVDDSVYWVAAVTDTKWYVTTFAIRSTSGAASVTTTNAGTPKVFVNGTLTIGEDWQTFGIIGQADATGDSYLYFILTDTNTIRLSCIQCIQFDTLQQAMNFLDSGVYVLKPTEVKKRDYAASAAPAAGTWVVGDIVWNSEPASTEAIGWVCTVAGTPGTWKAFGTIA